MSTYQEPLDDEGEAMREGTYVHILHIHDHRN
jgi:hypothetical protein